MGTLGCVKVPAFSDALGDEPGRIVWDAQSAVHVSLPAGGGRSELAVGVGSDVICNVPERGTAGDRI